MTDSQREKDRLRKREEVAWRRSRGLCIYCGKEPARPNKSSCQRCAMNSADQSGVFYEHRKENGLCVRCGKKTDGQICCPDCRQKDDEQHRLLRIKRKKQGLCTKCGKKLELDNNGLLCGRCKAKANEAKWRMRQRRKAA